MNRTRFISDLTIQIDPEFVEKFFEKAADIAEELGGTLTSYRYYARKYVEESQRN